MYSLCSVSILHKTPRRRELTPADILQIIKTGTAALDKCLVTTYWGIWRNLQEAMEELKQIPRGQYQHYLEGIHDGIYQYVWEGVVLYEDGRAVCVFDEPYKGRG